MTTFWASLGNFVQKSFSSPKIYLLLHLCRAALLAGIAKTATGKAYNECRTLGQLGLVGV